MGLADRVEAITPARDARLAMVRSENAFARRLAESMGPGTDDTQFRQRLTLLISMREKLSVMSGGSAGTFASSLAEQVIPNNYRYIRDTMSHHPLRNHIFTDAGLQGKAVDIATADGPIWNRLRAAMLANEPDSMLGSLARMYEDGTAESAGPIRQPVTDFFARLEQLDSSLHGRATSGITRALPGGPTIPPSGRVDYTNGSPGLSELPIGRDVPPAEASRRSGGRTTTTGGSSGSTGAPAPVATSGGAMVSDSGAIGYPVPGYGSGGGGGYGSLDAPPPQTGSGETLRKIRLIREIARDLRIGVPALVSALVRIYTLWVLIRRGQRMMGMAMSSTEDDDITGSATVRELEELGSIANDDGVGASRPLARLPNTDPVAATFGMRRG